jgi:hypothetical protein
LRCKIVDAEKPHFQLRQPAEQSYRLKLHIFSQADPSRKN